MRTTLHLTIAALALSSIPASAQTAVNPVTTPPAIFADPPADAQNPPRMEVPHIPSGGVAINGVAYLAAGAGPKPTLVICHGWPGNEKNLDLAQALRRAGWNAITFNYRGSWGSPGAFRFAQVPEDARAVLAFLRDPARARALGADPEHFRKAAPGLAKRPLLVLTSNDTLASHTDPLVAAVKAAGGWQTAAAHVATGHSWPDRRIELPTRIIRWLETLVAPKPCGSRP